MDPIDILKNVIEIVKKSGEMEIYEKLLEVKEKLFTLREENIELKEKLKFKENLEYKKNAFWTKNGEGPYCPGCWGKDQKPIRMQPCGNPAWSECPVCKEQFQTGEDKGWSPPASSTRDPYEYI